MQNKKTLTVLAVLLTLSARAVDFETPPAEPAAASLSKELSAGENFHVIEPVVADGLMHHYVIDGRFGVFPAYGLVALQIRVREIAALTQLSKITDVDEIAKTVKRHVDSDVKTIGKFVSNPVGTVVGIPKGIGHLFNGYKAQANELSASSKQTDASKRNGNSNNNQSDTKADTARYADRYFGVSKAERRIYQELGVDPYTTNVVLRKTVHHLAKVDAGTNLGMHFVGVPGVPYLGDVRRAMDAVYNEDPAVLRARQRAELAAYGLTLAEISRFQNTILLSPTRQTLLEAAAKALDGVTGRDELFRHAMSLTSEDEVAVFLQSTGLLVQLHVQQPIVKILAGLRLPTAQFSNGRIVVVGSFDAVFWTEAVASYESELHKSLAPGPSGLELWLGGSVSALARAELTKRGWDVHDNATHALPVNSTT